MRGVCTTPHIEAEISSGRGGLPAPIPPHSPVPQSGFRTLILSPELAERPSPPGHYVCPQLGDLGCGEVRPTLHTFWAFLPLSMPQFPHLCNGLLPRPAAPPGSRTEWAKASTQAVARCDNPFSPVAWGWWEGAAPSPTPLPSIPSSCSGRNSSFPWGSWLQRAGCVSPSAAPGLCQHRRKKALGGPGSRSGRGGDLGQEAALHKTARSRADDRLPFTAQAVLCVTCCACCVWLCDLGSPSFFEPL